MSAFVRVPALSSGVTFISDDSVQPFPEDASQAKDYTVQTNAVLKIPSERFRVRTGPNYASNKQKLPSKDSLYELIGCDSFKVDRKVFNVGRFIDLSSLGTGDEFAAPICGVPHLFVFNALIPDHSVEDGSGFLIILYFRLKPSTAEELRLLEAERERTKEAADAEPNVAEDAVDEGAPTAVSNSVRLLERYINCPPGDALELRFKVVPKLLNMDDCNLPWALNMAMSTSYNGKPFLSRPQHQMYKEESYFELDLDVFEFNWLSKWALGLFVAGWREGADIIRNLVGDLALVVEGHDDSELPEQIIGGFQLQGLSLATLTLLDPPIDESD